MAQLSDEIILFGILTRVPPKAVGRFKSVCKAWNASLSGNAFVRDHCSRSAIPSNQKVLLIEHQTCSIHSIKFETHHYETDTSMTIPFNHQSYDPLLNAFSILHIWMDYCVFAISSLPSCSFGTQSLPLSNDCHTHIPTISIKIFLMQLVCTPTRTMISKSFT